MRRALLLCMLFATGALFAAPIPLEEYVGRLERIRLHVAEHRLGDAKSEAAKLRDVEVVWAHGRMQADDSLLDAVAQSRSGGRALLARIDGTLAELRSSGALTSGAVDPKLLAQVAAEQDVPELAKGGEVQTKLEADVPLLERIARSIADAWRWVNEKIGKLLEWFIDLFPRSDPSRPGATSGLRWIVWVVVAVIVLLVAALAISVIRRSRRAPAAVERSEPLGSRRDEDPLSRGATEWERYALQLAAAGRYREAIRAWYHAVLVTCYAAGVLSFRKGRTNWEYVATLPPSLGWRAEMIRLTRDFEREWYGADESTRAALEQCSAGARSILDSVRQRGAA